jgi:hypothetical protein
LQRGLNTLRVVGRSSKVQALLVVFLNQHILIIVNQILLLDRCTEVVMLGVIFLSGKVFLELQVLILLRNLSHQRKVFDLYLIILFVLNRFILQELVVSGSSLSILGRFWRKAFGLEQIKSAVCSLSQLYLIRWVMIDDLVWGLVDLDAIHLHRIVEDVLSAILLLLIWHGLELRGLSILI